MITLLLFFTLSLLINPAKVFAQDVAFWIRVSDSNANVDTTTLWFGSHHDATYPFPDTICFPCINPSSDSIMEQLAPLFLPGFDVHWYSIPGRVNTWGQGLLKYDFRPWSGSMRDTFRLRFQNTDNPSANFLFHWSGIMDYDSLNCRITGGPLINMLEVYSLFIPSAGDNGINTLTIYKKNMMFDAIPYDCSRKYCKTAVEIDSLNIPPTYSLVTNYPNPFNPITTFSFAVPHLSHVTITVTNVLGQQIATIIDKEYPAGIYSQTWDATNLSSGIYFYKMQVNGKFSETKKLLLMK
jgi:hypothetical protein